MTQPDGPVAKLAGKASTFTFPLERSIKVALVEDQTRAREHWPRLIDSFADLTCVCSCESAEEALAVIPQKLPDVVLMDIFLPGRSGIECTARLKALLPSLQIVMFTTMEDQKLLFMSLAAGADGYLLKRTKPADLRNAIFEVLGGGVPLTGQIARCLVKSFRQTAKTPGGSKRLSLREEWILILLCQGYERSSIADKLGLSINTVCSHLKRAYKKLGVCSRTEAVVRYLISKSPQPRPDDSPACWPDELPPKLQRNTLT